MQIASEHKIQLLLVDDNPGDVQLFRWALKRAEIDCELSVIADGGEALAMVRRESAAASPHRPDLVVLDLNLPKADGREILTAMRSTAVFSEVPVVILTSSTAPREREQLQSLRVARHLVKPPDFKEFMNLGAIVKQVLEEHFGRSGPNGS